MIETLPDQTKFESFEEPELVNEPLEQLECREALVNKLQLKGQKEILKKKRVFPLITREQAIVFRFFCPQDTKLSEYDLSPIPLRVLELADKAASQGINCLTVWHPAQVKTDPILVGSLTDSLYTLSNVVLIARWGSELEEWPALVSSFRTRAADAFDACLEEAKAKAKALRIGGLDYLTQNTSAWYNRFSPSFSFLT